MASAKQNVLLVPGLLCTAALYAPQIAALKGKANVTVGDTTRHDNFRDMAHSILAERDLLAGAAAAARDRLAPLLDRPGEQEAKVAPLLPLLAWAHAELDDEEAASRARSARPRRSPRSTSRRALAKCTRSSARTAPARAR